MSVTAEHPKRGPGRPCGSGAGRTARVEWRTTPERKALAEQQAVAAGLSLSAWLDRAVDAQQAAGIDPATSQDRPTI